MTDQAKVVADDAAETTSVSVNEPAPKLTWKTRVLGIIWDSLDKSPEERKFIRKADFWILTYVCVGYFVKYLDQTNVTNAYVSGMKEDLHMSGQDYNLLQTMFTVGYILGNFPSQLIMTKVRPSIWLPTLELLWGFLVMAMAGAKSVKTLYVLRFFIGLLEASAYPGILTLLGNWYTPQELGKRTAIFLASASISNMFSGYLQAGLYSGMDGTSGLRAWQWLFIFDGIIGIPVSLYGYFAVPDSPANTKARWLNKRDKAIAKERMDKVGRKAPRGITLKTVLEAFRMWPVYLFTIAFTGQVVGSRISNYFGIYLKSAGYSVVRTNLIPTGGYGIQGAVALLLAWFSDAIRKRYPLILVAATLGTTGCIILSVYPEHNKSAMIAGWYLTYIGPCGSALVMSWVNELLSYSMEQRLIVIGLVETFAFVFNAWVILLAYPSGQAPRFKIGYEMAAMLYSIYFVAIAACAYCAHRWKPGPKRSDEVAEVVVLGA
ncbi:hypothetical protein VTK73DRAFT_9371 [Phialemonium thermophilum]|uniref:Major facilitator superfamily (MFS) profile domain-containing protein n=1 Tax=Phialemonium thermophilum TaxID=223376 RepID=A0ABR3W2S9_9PEZI